MKKFCHVLIVLGIAISAVACHSATAPSPPVVPPVEPNPAPGTVPISFELPNASKPLLAWAIEVTPTVGGQLVSGKGTARVRFMCSGPSGYYILIMTAYVFENGETVSQGGFTMETSSDCPVSGSGGTIPSIGNGFVVTPSTPNIASIRYSLWINQGPIHETPTSPPDQVKEIILNWRGPGQ